MQFAVGPHSAGLIGKVAALAGAVALLLGAGGSILGAGQSDLRALRDMYRRPAAIPYPKDDPYSRAKYELGRTLFFDPICPAPNSDPVRHVTIRACRGRTGSRAQLVKTRSRSRPDCVRPTLLNVAWTPKLGWDGHFRDLEGVAIGPITSPENMNLPETEMLDRLSAIPGYVDAFDAAFGKGEITRARSRGRWRHSSARSCRNEAPFDRWIKGDPNAIDAAAKRGFDLFNGKAQLRGLPQRLGLHRRVFPRHRGRRKMTTSAAAGYFRLR